MISIIFILSICVIFLYVGFIFKGKMDWSGANKFELDERYKNRNNSWTNKYKVPLEPYVPKWYYGAFDFKLFGKRFKFNGIEKPLYREKFIWSSTALVFLTDYWHMTQFYFLNSITLCISILIAYIGYLLEGNIYYFFFSSVLVVELVYWLGFKTGFRDAKYI